MLLTPAFKNNGIMIEMEVIMLIVVVICWLLIALAFEIRHRLMVEQINQLEKEMRQANDEIKKLKEDVQKKQDAEPKKGFKLPFLP